MIRKRAATVGSEDGWDGFAGPGPNDPEARSDRRERRRVGRLCRTGPRYSSLKTPSTRTEAPTKGPRRRSELREAG